MLFADQPDTREDPRSQGSYEYLNITRRSLSVCKYISIASLAYITFHLHSAFYMCMSGPNSFRGQKFRKGCEAVGSTHPTYKIRAVFGRRLQSIEQCDCLRHAILTMVHCVNSTAVQRQASDTTISALTSQLEESEQLSFVTELNHDPLNTAHTAVYLYYPLRPTCKLIAHLKRLGRCAHKQQPPKIVAFNFKLISGLMRT
jgi:hypothetical protein